jgi:hypothetical protein
MRMNMGGQTGTPRLQLITSTAKIKLVRMKNADIN